MSRRGRVSFGESPIPIRYDDGEVSFTVPPLSPSSLPPSSGTEISLPIRRRRPGPAVSAVSAQPSGEELRTPASFTVAGDGSPIAGAAASITVNESSLAVAEFHVGGLPRQGSLRSTGDKLGVPGQVLSIGLTGPHPSSSGHKYCLTAIDCFTKYFFLAPLCDKSAFHVAQALMSFFLQHGFYYGVVKSDNGTEFINSSQAELDNSTQMRRFTS
jgi:hypothetical protein